MSSDKSAAADEKPVAWRWKWKDSALHGWQYSHGNEKPNIHSANADFIDFDPLYTRPAATSNEAARDAILSAVTKFNELLIVELFTGRENKATRSDMRNLAKTFNPEYWGISAAPPAPTGEAVQPDAVVVDNLSIGDDPDFVEVARTYRKSPTGASYRAMCAYIDARPAASGAGAPPAATPALLGLSDTHLLDALTEHVKWELAMDLLSEDQEWCIWNITGSPNDREWHEIGRGNSPRAAIIAALKEKP